MKILHTSDLHIGKKLKGFSLREDQIHMLEEIVRIAREEKVGAILVAGDVYDSSTPIEESFYILDKFLSEASQICPVYIIAGNHDSEGRLSIGHEVMSRAGVHIVGPYTGKAEHFILEDEFGPLNLYLMPYVSRSRVRSFYRDADVQIDTSDAAVKYTLDRSEIEPTARNILVAHQAFSAVGTDLVHAESETDRNMIGKTPAISSEMLGDFNYCALGHIHTPQSTGSRNAVYCGTPIKYDFSEINDSKHVNIIEADDGEFFSHYEVPVVPLREMVHVEGAFQEAYDAVPSLPRNAQVYVTLTEEHEDDRQHFSARCESCGCTLFDLDYRIERKTDAKLDHPTVKELSRRSDIELFAEFFNKRTGKVLSAEQEGIMGEVFAEAARSEDQ